MNSERGKRPSPLGLFAEDEARPSAVVVPTGLEAASSAEARSEAATAGMMLSVIIPARNEELVLGECIASLLAQDDARIWALGRDWELLVVDDDSTDRTRAVAEEALGRRAGTRLLRAPAVDTNEMTGKSAACWYGAGQAGGKWLLFTDADTLHEPGNLQRALHEAEKHHAALLSYSPRQVMTGLAQRLVMPLVFSELASVYPPADVNDPEKRTAAANGQFLMVDREVYFYVSGHRALGRHVLEDVELARNVKRGFAKRGRGLRFRYAPDALSTRMYRGFGDMVEGWTKNLALLFPHAVNLALWRLLDIALLLLPVVLWLLPYLVLWQRGAIVLIWVRTLFRFYSRVARAHMGFAVSALSVLGLPLFVWLLLKSWARHRFVGEVQWKGRSYKAGAGSNDR